MAHFAGLTYFYVYLQSNLLEVPAYHWGLGEKKQSLETLALCTFMNSLTHPIVFFLIMNLPLTYLQNTLFAESFAIFSETFIMHRVLKRGFLKTLLVSTFANLVSWQLAPMLSYGLFF